MNLQEKIISLSEYKLGFNIYSGHTIINVTYPKTWSVIKPENENITFACDEVNKDTYYYSAPITFNMEEIFDNIEATIDFNKEMEKKIELFQTKQAELQNIFIEESYETLETLTFSFKKKKKQVKQTQPKENIVKEIKEEPQQKEDNETEEMTVDEIKNNIKKHKEKKSKQKISSHKDNLEILPGEEVCEEIIISNSELNNGIY
jgi:hypothetical protein